MMGKPMLGLLDSMDITKEAKAEDFRFPVQYVNRPHLNFRGFCGTIAAGSVKVGDEITVLPSGKSTKVKSIINAGDITEANREATTTEAYAPMAVTITTEDEVDISRGDMLVHTQSLPAVSNNLKVMLVWMDETPMSPVNRMTSNVLLLLYQGTLNISTIKSMSIPMKEKK